MERAVTSRKSVRPAASGRAPRTAAKADDDRPLYLRVASDLKRDIAKGKYPVGARLPTELELCEQRGISRFTARAAIRVLTTAGLVSRRQRVGTVVVALPDDARYSHDAKTVRDLMQYAKDTELNLVYIGKIALGKAQAREFKAEVGEEWTYAMGLRRTSVNGDPPHGAAAKSDGRPICVTRIYLSPVLKGIETRLRGRSGAVYMLIERDYGLSIQRVEQEMYGVLLDADDAANLGSKPHAPALRIVRRYFGENEQLLQVADSVHPSDRFTYRMELRK